MKKPLKKIVLSLLALFSLGMNGAPIDQDAAFRVASRFLSSGSHARVFSPSRTLRLAHVEFSSSVKSANYYVFDYGDGGAFVIVAGDDRAHEVLAYGTGHFNVNDIPDNLRWFLDRYAAQVEYLHTHPMAKSSSKPKASSEEPIIIPELLSTKWGQGSPYRNMCPTIDGKPCVTGCIATSMAQVMNYWHFPAVLPALSGYVTGSQQISVSALPSESVEWDLMQDTYTEGSYTSEQGNAVAMLMRYCGQSSKMNYSISNSGSLPDNQLKGLKTFGYSKNAVLLDRSDYSDEAWNDLILDDLSHQRPVLYAGFSSSINHSFVIDGFDGNKYHINWGWNGYGDGYYELDALSLIGLKPTDMQQLLHGVCPDPASLPDYNCDFVKNSYCYKISNDYDVAFVRNVVDQYSGDIVIPDTVRFNGYTYNVTAIGKNAFLRCNKVNSVVLPSTLISIGTNAFSQTSLSSIVIPSMVTTIGDGAFKNCTKLSQLVIGDRVTVIDEVAFNRCSKLSSVVLPSSLTSVAANTFSKTSLSNILIPPQMATIGNGAFEDCPQMSQLNVSSARLTIGNQAFVNAPLTEITISDFMLPTANPDCFDDEVYENATLRVMRFLENLIPDIEPWKMFSHVTYFNDSTLIAIDDYYFRQNSDSTLILCNYHGEQNSILIPRFVTIKDRIYIIDAIDELAFSNNLDIIDVVIPETVKAVGTEAFSGCENLRRLTIMSSEMTLGNNAFAKTAISDVICKVDTPPLGNVSCFPSSVYNNAVLIVSSSSKLLYEATEPWLKFANITSFDNDLVMDSDFCYFRTGDNEACILRYLGNADSVVIPDTLFIDDLACPVRNISDYTFRNKGQLQSISIPGAVNHIGRFAFYGCSSLKGVEFPDSLKIIGDYAFYGCSGLKDVVFPDSLNSIGDYAFSGCTNLLQISLPNAVNYLGTGAFVNARNLTHVSLGNGITIIPKETFFDCRKLTRIFFGDNVQTIGAEAFSRCFVLDSLFIPPSLSFVGKRGFYCCYGLDHVFITDLASWCQISFEDIFAMPFGGRSIINLQEPHLYLNGTEIIDCVIPDGVSAINGYAFACCNSIKHVFLPNSVTSIGNGSFQDCLSLESIDLPVGLSFLGDFCFSNCKQLQTIVIPDSVRRIGVQAFYNCTSLFELRLGSALLSIGKYAFRNCSMLTALELPDALESLGEESFRYCSNLSSIKFGMGLKSIGAFAFATCGCLSELDLPRGVKEIGAGAFRDNKGLIKITLPDSITTISGWAFTNCNKLQQIEIPGLVVMINNLAFYGCSSLSSIVSRATAPPVIFSNSFSDDTYQNAEVFVPQSAEMSYKNDANWKRFKSIMGICMSEVVGDVNCDSEVNIADVNVLIDAMFNNDVDSVYDLNGDGEIGIGDINSLLDIILRPD